MARRRKNIKQLRPLTWQQIAGYHERLAADWQIRGALIHWHIEAGLDIRRGVWRDESSSACDAQQIADWHERRAEHYSMLRGLRDWHLFHAKLIRSMIYNDKPRRELLAS